MAYGVGPNLVRDGLVLYLDAANPKSYPGSGTTWNDLSGNGNHGTLVDGPIFTLEGGGSFILGGSGNLRRCTLPITSGGLDANNITLNVIAKASPQSNGSLLFIFNNLDYLVIGNFTGGVQGPPSGEAFSMVRFEGRPGSTVRGGEHRFTDGVYHDFTFIRNNITDEFYVDGQLVGTFNNSQISSSLQYPIALGQRSSNTYFGTMESVIYKIYNRALTPEEILQNYNAARGRFGL